MAETTGPKAVALLTEMPLRGRVVADGYIRVGTLFLDKGEQG